MGGGDPDGDEDVQQVLNLVGLGGSQTVGATKVSAGSKSLKRTRNGEKKRSDWARQRRHDSTFQARCAVNSWSLAGTFA